MSQEVQFVEVCQRIQEELERLEKGRTIYNPFASTTDLKIQILNRLRQLMLAPESFSKEDLKKYFEKEGEFQSISLKDLISKLLNDETYCKDTFDGSIGKVNNGILVDANRTVFTKSPTKNREFYTKLAKDFGDLIISPPSATKYSFRKDQNKAIDKKKDKGKLFVQWNEETEELSYRVIDPKGEVQSGQIDKKALQNQLGLRYKAFHEAVSELNPRKASLINPFLFDILRITSSRGHTNPLGPQRTYDRIIYLGDSLTDKGQMYESIMGTWSGLIGTSPNESFCNTRVWAVTIDNNMAIELLRQVVAASLGIDHYESYLTCSKEEREKITNRITKMDEHLRQKYKASFGLANNSRFTIRNDAGEDVVFSITNAIGGLTAHSYFGVPSFNIVRFFTRLMLSTLGKQTEKLLEEEKEVSPEARAKTVVHILAGANDLVTVNARPSHEEVDRAVEAIMENMEKLWQAGYRQFALSDLPDLSLTPRFQYESRVEQLNAKVCTEYFNRQLKSGISKFKSNHLDSAVDVFGLRDLLQDGVDHPKKYGFSTSYALEEVKNNEDWEGLNFHSQGCGFHRTATVDAKKLPEFIDKLEDRAYLRMGNSLFYFDRAKNANGLTLLDVDITEFDKEIKCADHVKKMPENKLKKIANLIHKAYEKKSIKNKHNPSKYENFKFKSHDFESEIKPKSIEYEDIEFKSNSSEWSYLKHYPDAMEYFHGIKNELANYVEIKESHIPSHFEFDPRKEPKNNTIYYQIKGNNFNYQVRDAYDRLRSDTVTKEEFDKQVNGCALLRVYTSPVNDKNEVIIDIPSASAFVRHQDKLYYIRRSTTDMNDFHVAHEISFEDKKELLDQFDARFKPWYASRQLSEQERADCQEFFNNKYLFLKGTEILDPKINSKDAVPYLQAILAERDHVIARGDLWTPAQETKAFKRLIEESGPVLPGDLTPTSNKAFNDRLHPLGDFDAHWADRFWNDFLDKLYRFVPDAIQFMKQFLDIEDKPKKAAPTLPDLMMNTGDLVKSFAIAYNEKLVKEQKNIFRMFSPEPEANFLKTIEQMDNEDILGEIFSDAEKSKRTKEVLIELNWINKDSSLTVWATQIKQLRESRDSNLLIKVDVEENSL